jgi:hypothetical protein
MISTGGTSLKAGSVLLALFCGMHGSTLGIHPTAMLLVKGESQ